jgi:membrane-bound lytic murein transglycosylase D
VQYLFLPKNKVAEFVLNADSIYNFNKVIQPQNADVAIKQYVKVRRNENLKSVSLRIGVTVSDLKKWNNIRGSYVKPGRWLAYYTAQKGGAETVNSDEQSGEKTEPKHEDAQALNNRNETPVKTNQSKYASYTVRSGDTLYKIAERKNVSATSIKKINPSVNWNRLQIGQKIKIPTG